MYDAIVVGARCAGSPAAMLLAKKGYKVLLIDRAKLPSDKPLSSHLLLPNAVAALKRFGLLEKLKASNCPPIKKVKIDWGKNYFVSSIPPVDGIEEAYCPRRYVLDPILLEGALNAGVDFRQEANLTNLIFEDDQVVGIEYQTKEGTSVLKEKARIVIGADGLFSKVAKMVGAQKHHEYPIQSAICFSYWRDVPIDAGVCMYMRPNRSLVLGRTNDGLTIMQDYMPVKEFQNFKKDLGNNFLKDYREFVPEIYDSMMKGEQADKWIATGNQPNFFRTPMGSGWALVGDASLHHDSINPTGITYAFVNTEQLIEKVDRVLKREKTFKQAKEDFENWRLNRWLSHFQFLVNSADPSSADPQMLNLLNVMSQDEEVAYQFMGFFSGSPQYESYFSPEGLKKIFESHGPKKDNSQENFSTQIEAVS